MHSTKITKTTSKYTGKAANARNIEQKTIVRKLDWLKASKEMKETELKVDQKKAYSAENLDLVKSKAESKGH